MPREAVIILFFGVSVAVPIALIIAAARVAKGRQIFWMTACLVNPVFLSISFILASFSTAPTHINTLGRFGVVYNFALSTSGPGGLVLAFIMNGLEYPLPWGSGGLSYLIALIVAVLLQWFVVWISMGPPKSPEKPFTGIRVAIGCFLVLVMFAFSMINVVLAALAHS